MTGKPINDSGMYCPLARQWCAKACHTCEMWEPLEVTVGAVVQEQYKCALKWPAVTGAVANAKLHGMGKAFEELRNEFAAFKGSIVALVQAMGVAARQIDQSRPPVVVRVIEPEAKNAANEPG